MHYLQDDNVELCFQDLHRDEKWNMCTKLKERFPMRNSKPQRARRMLVNWLLRVLIQIVCLRDSIATTIMIPSTVVKISSLEMFPCSRALW